MKNRTDTKQIDFIFDLFRSTQPDDLNYIYRGHFTNSIIENILSLAERNIEVTAEASTIKKRVYFIMVECLQNITRYQAKSIEKLDKTSIFVIQKRSGYYFITTGNLIENDKIAYVKKHLERVNSLDSKELKEYYREILKNGEFTDKGGAGLGLIEMARKSGNKLSFSFKKIDEKYSYFYLNTIILSVGTNEKKENENSINKIVNLHQNLNEYGISLIYNSGFSQENLLGLLSIIENQMHNSAVFKKKLFNVIVEMLQNIIHHGALEKIYEESIYKPGIFFIQDNEKEYILSAGNYIANTQINQLRKKLDKVNKLNSKELDKFYSERLFDFNIDTKLEAGLGIIDMRMKSAKKLAFSFRKLNDKYSFFILEISIKK